MPARVLLFSLVLAILSTVCLKAAAPESGAVELSVDASRTIGTLRPIHGVNGGPLDGGGLVDLSPFYRQWKIPLVRLHDCHWPNPDVVDFHALFPDPQADPSRPESYDFARTDDYLAAIVRCGASIVFRLGQSIEHTPKKYHVHPPADPQRWADVALGIVRHYNDGWANGFHHNIRYWEIWNEPENRPVMWTGSDDDYYRLYTVAAKTIKARFPQVLVGGPGLGNTGGRVDGAYQPPEFLKKFLDHCRRNAVPLDFFSWHIYTDDPRLVVERAGDVRELLDQYGFTKTETQLNEWNDLPNNDWGPMLLGGQGAARERLFSQLIGGPHGAAFTAAVLMALQDSPVDAACYYKGDCQGFGLFNEYGTPKKATAAFQAFSMLLETPGRLSVQGPIPGQLYLAAGVDPDHTQLTAVISQLNGPARRVGLSISHLPWSGRTEGRVLILDTEHDLSSGLDVATMDRQFRWEQDLPSPSICVVRLKKVAGKRDP